MTLVEADLKCLYIDVGTNGRVGDGGVWAEPGMGRQHTVPPPEELPGPLSLMLLCRMKASI